MDKRYQVFVSSTYADLKEERQHVIQALMEIPPNLTVSGSDGKWYIYRVKELIKYLTENFGSPDITVVNKPYQAQLNGKKGIIIFEVDAWDDASGHATLWDGITCSDKCYFPLSRKVMLWEIK